ncbi:MAG: hypothetical protein ABIJ14_02920 [Nanoarchaeota archaeon]
MKKGVLFFVLLMLILLPIASAGSVDSEMQKVTHYAEEFETGNINYVQFLVHLSSVRENLNEILGATGKEYGGIVKQEQVRAILGEPEKETKWVWVENEEREKKVESSVPIWEKIIFDGKKIQIRLNAFPSIIKRKTPELKAEIRKLEDEGRIEEVKLLEKEGEETLVYRLNFNIEFKKPKEQLDINSKINDIQTLAQDFNSDSSDSNAEKLAKESVNAERIFESYFRQNQGKCEDVMISIFGSENKKDTMKTIVHEIDFYEGENFEAIMRLEMCDDCNWNWINLNMWFEGRGKFNPPEMKDSGKESRERFKQMTSEEFKAETTELIEDIIIFLEQKKMEAAFDSSSKLMTLTESWNEVSNNVWEEVDKEFRQGEDSMTEEERQKLNENYGWIKREQEKRNNEKELRQINYEERKQFYLGLFSAYDKKEFYFEQEEYEKRLVQEFKTFEKEICDNNVDDNEDGGIDCSDEQCGGKLCGKIVGVGTIENETFESVTELYCIAGACQAKEEFSVGKKVICGNHICEENETLETCAQDCAGCKQWDAVNCSGKVIFSGKDINGCPLEPICLSEEKTCEADEDCTDPLCGDAICLEGLCVIEKLKECAEVECTEGQEKVKKCGSAGEITANVCVKGVWESLNTECEEETGEVIIENSEEIVGNDCIMRDDCGGEDVCSNGRCITIPKVAEVEESYEELNLEDFIDEDNIQKDKFEDKEKPRDELKEDESDMTEENKENKPEISDENSAGEETQGEVAGEPEQSSEEPESTLTGGVIFNFFRAIAGKVTGSAITESFVEDEGNEIQQEVIESDEGFENNQDVENTIDSGEKNNFDEGNKNDIREGGEENNWVQEDEERREEDKENRKNECRDRCDRECNDRIIKPCVEPCVWDECGDMLECNIDEITKNCESGCKSEKNIDDCVNECEGKCMKGENTWEEPEWEKKQEELGVFSAGGGCRTSQGKTEGFIWFNGWGEPFDEIQPLKQKYYQGGQADWCKWDLENLIKQRREFEKSFNQKFAEWFFDDYMANTAEDWEQHQSGIFELYWNIVDNSRQISERMNCLGIEEIPFDYKLLNLSYETAYGSIEYWEEVQDGKMNYGTEEEMEMITPYMKVWIFPPKEFIQYELKKAMKEQSFPGSPEEKMERENEGGPTAEEKEKIKQDKSFMKKLKSSADKYGGNIDAVVQFKDFETNEVVFNLYAQINEEDILMVTPMLPENVPAQDVKIEMDFEFLYNLIYTSEKDMSGERIESPPWAERKIKPIEKIKEVTNGIQVFLKVRKMINSATITPKEAKKDVDKLFKDFLWMMMKGGMDDGKGPDEGAGEKDKKVEEIERGLWEDKGVLN